MKLLVPVYDTSLVAATVKAAKAGGHIAAIVNPDSGPGRNAAVIKEWKPLIKQLKDAGAQVLYYLDLVQQDGDQGIAAPAAGKEKTEATVKSEMDKYIANYGTPTGWFFDDLWDFTPTRLNRLKKLVAYKGGFTVANPGTGASKTYLTSGVTVMIVWEKPGYTGSHPAAWEAANGPRLGVMALAQASFHPALNLAIQRKVNLFYATTLTDAGGANAYSVLPSYFAAMAAAI